MLKTKSLACLLLVATVMVTVFSSTFQISARNQSQQTRKAEQFIYLAARAKEKVSELTAFIQQIEDGIEIPENITQLIEEANAKLETAQTELNVTLAKEAMQIYRKVFGQLHTLLGEGGVDIETHEQAKGLFVAINRTYERIARINDTITQIIERFEDLDPEVQTYLSWVKGNLTEAAENLAKAENALLLEPPNVVWAAHNLTEANKNISEAFAALRQIAGWTDHWRIENFLRCINRTRERVHEALNRAIRQGKNVTALLESLGYTDENDDGSVTDDFLRHIQNLINSAEDEQGTSQNAIKDLNMLRKMLNEVHKEMAKHGVSGGKGNSNGNKGNGQPKNGGHP